MSTGNGAAAIGLANTNKRGPIGAYAQDAGANTVPGPSAGIDFAGVNGNVIYDRNVLGEDVGFTVSANSGAAAGKLAQWVTSGASTIASGTTRVAVSGGTATADNAAGAYDIWVPTTVAIPAGSYFWAFGR